MYFTIHMQLGSKDIPEECSRAAFPFCKVCEEFVKQLWDFQRTLDMIRLKISKLVTRIERTVVDGEILNPKIGRNLSQQKNFVKLGEMILQGYRNKLLAKQQMMDNIVLNNPVSDFEHFVNFKLERNEDVSRDDLCPTAFSCMRLEKTADLITLGEHDIIEELVDLQEIEIPQEASSSSSSYLASLRTQNFDKQETTAMVPSFEAEDFHYNDDADENNDMENKHNDNLYSTPNPDDGEEVVGSNTANIGTLVISNIHGSDGATCTAQTPSLVQVKQEIRNQDDIEEEVEVDAEANDGLESLQIGKGSHDDIYMLEPRKRRLLTACNIFLLLLIHPP